MFNIGTLYYAENRVIKMIVYDPFWKTMKERGLTTYQLINRHGYSSHTTHRLRHNKGISTSLINELCILLDCRVEDILLFLPETEKNKRSV